MDSRVVNLRDYPRAGAVTGRAIPADVVRVDRGSKWGNPFRMSDGSCDHPDCGPKSHPPTTREMVIESYRGWLFGMLANQPDFLEPLRGKRLACWCAPKACHAEVILEALDAQNLQ